MREPKTAFLAITEVASPRIAKLPVAQTICCFFSYRSITSMIAQLLLLAQPSHWHIKMAKRLAIDDQHLAYPF
jgi:hypothetical protein